MSRLESIVEELKSLPPGKLEQAAEFIRQLKQISEADRNRILRSTAGSLTEEEGEELERIIKEGCERVDEREW